MNAVFQHRQAAALASRPGPADQKASTFSVRLLSPQVRDERVSDPASHPSHGATASDGSRPGQDMEITGDMCRRLEELVGSDQTSKRYIRGPDDHGFEVRPHRRGSWGGTTVAGRNNLVHVAGRRDNAAGPLELARKPCRLSGPRRSPVSLDALAARDLEEPRRGLFSIL